MNESEKPKKAEEMSKPELRAHIESLKAREEFRISQGVYVYRQADLALTYFVRIYYRGDKHEYWDHESQLAAEAFYSNCLREIEQSQKQYVLWDTEKYKKKTRLSRVQTAGMTIAEFGQWWFTTVVLENNPHTTQRKYREYLNNHVYPFFDNGARPMRSLTEFDLKQFSWHFKKKVSARTGTKLKVSTLHTILRMLYGFFCVAKEKGVIEEIPFTKSMTEIAGEKDEVELASFTPEQEAAFLAGVRRYEPEWSPLFLTLQRTAARTGEILALKEEDLDFKSRKIKIVRHFAEGKILDKTKTKKGRTIDMSEQLAHELQRYLAWRREEEQIRGIQFEFLFGWEADQPIAMRTLQEVYNSLRDFLKLPPVKLYGTRHTALARLYRETKDIIYTKKQAGHASLRSTMLYEEKMPRENKQVDCLDTPINEETVIERAASEPQATESAPPLACPPPVILPETGIDLFALLQRQEQDLLRQALERTKGNRQAAAALLGISYDTLLARLRATRRWEAKNGDGSGSEGLGASPAA